MIVTVVTVVVMVDNMNNPMADPVIGLMAGTLRSQMTDSERGLMTD